MRGVRGVRGEDKQSLQSDFEGQVWVGKYVGGRRRTGGVKERVDKEKINTSK